MILLARCFWVLMIAPLLPALVDLGPGVRAALGIRRIRQSGPPDPVGDFTVLVPIYGSVAYLENVDYLSRYADRVMLCTTQGESPDFYADLEAVASAHRFRIRRFRVEGGRSQRRQVSGTTRDRLIQQATELVTTAYVVCIDADTVTAGPLEDLVGAVGAAGLDLAGVQLVPCNLNRLICRLQAHEYRMAMRMRKLIPYITPGALQISKSLAHRQIMRRHSLFFQGNDAEMGLLAASMGLRVGYIPVAVPTTVPDTFHKWFRQRFAWAGGEFRIFVVNVHLLRRHPLFITYGAAIVFLLAPARWMDVIHPGITIGIVLGIYLVAIFGLNWRHRDVALALYPLYGLLLTLVVTPLGVVSYAIQGWQCRNPGLVRPRRPLHFRRRGQYPTVGAPTVAPSLTP